MPIALGTRLGRFEWEAKLLASLNYFQDAPGSQYDVGKDSRFLMVKEEEVTAKELIVVANRFDELHRLVPVNR
jgi:hypothetical protein